ncbi:UNVERIFIED_ORG: muconolactone delta-isomerase [Burkholderia contaminans]|nr:muconolactone delta-isomerase [Burkholderia contaminans]
MLLLLCAVLPVSGLAASGLTGECPMQSTMSMDADAGMSMSADMSGCDSMKASAAESTKAKAKGMACKLTAQCQFGSLYHPAARADVGRPAAFTSTIVFHYAQSVPIRDPNGLWRPPRIN